MVFFDLGWTLEDEQPAQESRARATVPFAARRGIRTSVEEILTRQAEAGRDGVRSVYPEALFRLGLTADDHRAARKELPWDPELCRLYPGVAEGLASLGNRRLGLIANQSRPMGPRLAKYGIAGYFQVVVCSCEVGWDKPQAEIFLLAAEQAAALGDPGPHWMVGDRVDNDVVPAQSLGWRTIRITSGDYRLYRSRGPGEHPDFEVAALAEAFAILRSRETGKLIGTESGPGCGRR